MEEGEIEIESEKDIHPTKEVEERGMAALVEATLQTQLTTTLNPIQTVF